MSKELFCANICEVVETIGHKVSFKVNSHTLAQNVTKNLFEVWPFILFCRFIRFVDL